MDILIVGSGGREHALAWRLKQSERCGALYCAPGNAGIAEVAECVPINVDQVGDLVRFAKEKNIGLVVIGPEVPLVLGLADLLKAEGIKAFGPSAKAAQLEGSKAFMKDLCAKYGIPTAAYGTFTDFEQARAFLQTMKIPVVIKADGLAAGKGVIIAQSEEEALEAVSDMLSGQRFGHAGAVVVIEEFLDGEEVSFFALADGETCIPLISAQDHKRVGEGDTGPNTGGMGAYAPANPKIMTQAMTDKVMADIILPTIHAMQKEGAPFQGVLFAGLMIRNGHPLLLEFNTRFGDPECQAIMMLLEGDLLELLLACAEQRLAAVKDSISFAYDVALCVTMAAQGYPDTYVRNSVIHGLERAGSVAGVKIFHAGTGRDAQGHVITTGGRVLSVTALAKTVAEAQRLAYEAIDRIDWPEGFCRRDIGWRAL
jgi:phosphoribosylamine--glycine ligase